MLPLVSTATILRVLLTSNESRCCRKVPHRARSRTRAPPARKYYVDFNQRSLVRYPRRMNQLFSLHGHCETRSSCHPEPLAKLWAELHAELVIALKHSDEYSLTVDSPVPINFGGIANANVVMLQPQGGSVTVAITSADGTSQEVPVDTLLIIISKSVPVTAISATRATGVTTQLNVFLAESA